jgi:hypothetical protein
MPYNKKTVSFYNKSTPLKKINIFDVFNQEETFEKTSEPHLPLINEIIWGKGFKSMIGVSWADECNA